MASIASLLLGYHLWRWLNRANYAYSSHNQITHGTQLIQIDKKDRTSRGC